MKNERDKEGKHGPSQPHPFDHTFLFFGKKENDDSKEQRQKYVPDMMNSEIIAPIPFSLPEQRHVMTKRIPPINTTAYDCATPV